MQEIPEKIRDIIQLAKQPITFKKEYYSNVLDPTRHFYWIEKTDGLRAVLIVINGNLYQLNKGEYILLDDGFPSSDIVVLDSEFCNGRYYVFDCLYMNYPVAEEVFSVRYKLLEAWLKKTARPYFTLKAFYEIHNHEDLEKAFSFLSLEYSPVSNNHIDGVILQDDRPVPEAVLYKWKRQRLITVDFFLRYNKNQDNYTLFVLGGADCSRPMKKISFTEELNIDNAVLYPVSIPLKENIHIFIPRIDWNRKDYTSDEIDTINSLIERAMKEPEIFDGKIVEMSQAEDGWVPIRIRNDKLVPNNYDVAFDNIVAYFEYPTFLETEMYYEDTANTAQTDLVHQIAHVMRDYQFKRLRQYLPDSCTDVLDIACGRGGDFEILADLGITNLFGIDRIYNCAIYARRANSYLSSCVLNLIPGYILGNDDDKIIKDIKTRAEYPQNGFSLFIIDYAIHYFLELPDGMKKLHGFISSLAAPGALLIFTAIDGDAMEADADENGILDLNGYSVPVNRTDHTAVMQLPTIKKQAQCERIFMSSDMEELGFELMDSFYPLLEKKDAFSPNNEYTGIIRFYEYMKAFILMV